MKRWWNTSCDHAPHRVIYSWHVIGWPCHRLPSRHAQFILNGGWFYGVVLISAWWFGTFFIFPYIGNFIIPIDFHIFQRGGPTTNQIWLSIIQSGKLHLGMTLRHLCLDANTYGCVLRRKIWRSQPDSPSLSRHPTIFRSLPCWRADDENRSLTSG